MTVNPSLVTYSADSQGPELYREECVVLCREFLDFTVDSIPFVQKWQARGKLYLTTLRLVFVAESTSSSSGVRAFDLPLAYLRNTKFNQPIFTCNNLAGEVWSTAQGGGPKGELPPHKFALYFKNGGVGTFLSLFFSLSEAVQKACSDRASMPSHNEITDTVATAFVDPNDPTKILLTEPVNSTRHSKPSAPAYAPNYGEDEVYEDMQSSAQR